MRVITWGDASRPALVLLHGFLGQPEDWQSIAETLSQHFYCLAPALPASGFTETSAQLDAWLETEKMSDYHLAGYSLGGRVAMYHVCHGQQKPASLFIEAGHPGLPDEAWTEREQRWQSDNNWASRFCSEPLSSVLDDWYRQPVFADLSTAQRQQQIVKKQAQCPEKLAATLRHFSLARQADLREALRRLGCPMGYCYGASDRKFAQLASSLKLDIPQLSLWQIPGSGHNCHDQQPAQFIQALNQFLAQPLIRIQAKPQKQQV